MGRAGSMEDYGREPWGAEDTFHSRFAAELEVLAEREGGPAGPEACGDLLSGAPGAKRPRLELAPRRVLRRAPVLQDFVSVTSTDGHRAFLVLRADPAEGPVRAGRGAPRRVEAGRRAPLCA